MYMVRIFTLASLLVFLMALNLQAAQTCQYNTQWGVLTITNAGSQVTGHYPHRNGTISGHMNYPHVNGTWRQSDGSGNFQYKFYDGGFTGNWNYSGDSGWRGQWNGQLIRCF